MNFKGKAKRLDDIDFPLVGRQIGVGEDEIHAVLDVEAAGTGFDKQGRPKMLFEPHVFWKQLGPGPKRDKAAAAGLAYPKWKRNYPDDSYPRLIEAMKIDEDAALRSASWGLPQMMGFNAGIVGYATAKDMVLAFLDDEETHLRALVLFIIKTGLADELKAHDWKGFARGYNGPGFAKNGYDRKLAQAFARWQKIKDTPVPAEAVRPTKPKPAKTPPRKAAQTQPPAKRPEDTVATKGRSHRAIPLVIGLMVGGYGAVAAWFNDTFAPVIDWLIFWN